MGIQIEPTIIVCPKCEHQFTNNRINGMALIEVAQNIDTRKRIRCRLTLDTLESTFGKTDNWPQIKKAVLDGYNDLARDIQTVLGFGTDTE